MDWGQLPNLGESVASSNTAKMSMFVVLHVIQYSYGSRQLSSRRLLQIP